jgi:Tfp pilus assembly protein PilF
MSILAKLLKKGDDRQEGGEVLPGLQQAVNAAGVPSDKRRRTYLLIAAGAAAAIAGGGLLVVYLQTRTPEPVIANRRPAVAPVIAPKPQAQLSSAKAVAVPPPPPVEVAVEEPRSKKSSPVARRHTVHQAASGAKKSAAERPEKVQSKELKPVVKDRATIDALLFAAKTAETRRDYNQALVKYRKVLEADPQNYRVMNNLASICLNLELYEEALSYANQALKLKGEYVSALVNGGIAQGRLGNQSGARAMLAKAVAAEPANRQALYNLALSQERANALDDAQTTWRRLADAGDANGLLGVARIKERRGESQEALRLYRDVLAQPEAGQRLKETARERIGVLDR